MFDVFMSRMNPITLLQPPRIVFGNGCAPQCAELLAQRGIRRVFLVTSTPMSPALDPVLEALRRAKIDVVAGPMIDCEPTRTMFAEALKVARAEQIEAA